MPEWRKANAEWEYFFNDREKRVMQSAGEGKSTTEIAKVAQISEHGVNSAKDTIRELVRSRPEFIDDGKLRDLPFTFALCLSLRKGLITNSLGVDLANPEDHLTSLDLKILDLLCDGKSSDSVNIDKAPGSTSLEKRYREQCRKLGVANKDAAAVKYTAMKLAGKFE